MLASLLTGLFARGALFEEVVREKSKASALLMTASAVHEVDSSPREKALSITLEHFDISQQMMGQTERLRPLEMGVTGDHRAAMTIGLAQQGLLQALEIQKEFIQATAQP